jgi:hypothetical protein
MAHRVPPSVRRALAAALAVVWALLAAAPAAAHGDVTGAQDIVQDYGVLIFLLAVVLLGAGVITWVALSPEPPADEPAKSEGDGG